MMVEGREEDTGRQAAPVENQSADIEAGGTSQGTSALEAEGKVEIKNQAVQGAEDKAICEKRAVAFISFSTPCCKRPALCVGT